MLNTSTFGDLLLKTNGTTYAAYAIDCIKKVEIRSIDFNMERLLHILLEHSDIISGLLYFFITVVGATITQLLSLSVGTVGVTPFLKMWWPKKSKNWYLRVNCIFLVWIGATLSFIILEPNSIKASLCAGLTWCGTLQSLGLTTNLNSND